MPIKFDEVAETFDCVSNEVKFFLDTREDEMRSEEDCRQLYSGFAGSRSLDFYGFSR